MRKTLLLLSIGLSPLLASSQTAIIKDDFDTLTAGELCAANSDIWTTWSGGVDGEDAYVSDAYAISGSNSVNIAGYNGPTDLVLPFPEDYTSGVYEFSLKAYITSGNGGYFNIQASSTPGVDWMFEILFDSQGGGFINAGGSNAATISYTPDTWMSINVRADLDNDVGQLFMNSHLIYSWQWSTGALGTSSIKQIGGVDIFAYSADGSNANMFIDNVMLSQITTTGIIVEDFEKNTPGQLLAANSDTWSTWSGGVDAEDAYVNDLQSNSGFNSVHIVGNNGPTDLYLPFPSDYTTGVYDFSLKMYVTSGNGGYFNIQQSSTPGLNWMFEIYFDDAGGGYINAGGNNAATVSYTPDSWTDIKVHVDLTNDQAELFLNSNSVYTWQWSLGATGGGAQKSMGGVDIFASAANSGNGDFYVDDVLLEQGIGVGTQSETFNPDILVAPNPSDGTFSVSMNDLPSGNYQIQLVDALGRVINSETSYLSGSVQKDFNINLSNGVYFLKITNGNLSSTKKIIVN